MKRPLLWVAVSFAIGAALATASAGDWSFLPGLVAIAGVIVTLGGRYDRRFFLVGVIVLFCAAGMLRSNIGRPNPAGDSFSHWIEVEAPEFVTIHGRVRGSELFTPGDDYLQCVVDVESIEHRGQRQSIGGRVLVRWNAANRPIFFGDFISILGTPTVMLSPVNWDVHSLEDSLRRRGIHAAVRCRGGIALSDYEPGSRMHPFNMAGHFRHALSKRLSKAVPEFAQAFIFAVWLGDKSHLTRDQHDSFVRSGTAHILAVSGVHTSIVFVTVSFVLGRFIRIARYRAIFIMVSIAVFALTAGARAATIRAAIMIAVYVLADVFDRERDAPTALSIAGFLFLLWDPTLLLDGGAQLSFLSLASILLFSDRLSARIPIGIVPIRQAIATTLSVQLLPLPVAASMFHLIPRFAPFANLIVVPLLGIVLWLCLITSVTAFLSPPLALIFGHAAGGVVFVIQAIAEFTAALPFSTQSMTRPTTIAAILYWMALAVGIVRSRFDLRRRAVAVVALLFLSFVFWRPIGLPAQVRILDVGHGDAAIVRSSSGDIAVIDGGDRSEYVDMGARVVIPSLSAMGSSHIDYLFVSHSDSDHLGGLITVVDRMSVGRVVMGPADPDNTVEEEFIALCERRRIPIVRASHGDQYRLGESNFTVLHPPKDWPGTHSRNDLSLVIRLDWEGPAVLFTGDIEDAAERTLARQPVRTPILKAPHHGSDSSSSASFIEAVAPEIVLISAGDSRRRISNPGAVIDRYREAGVQIWQTSQSGGLSLRATPTGVQVEGARHERGYPGTSAGSP